MTEGSPVPPGEWYLEDEPSGFLQGLRIRERLAKVQTPYQTLEILDTDAFGRVLILDETLQTSEWDEFMYHEMLVHVPLMTHPDPSRVLIIGGGDGGSLRRVLQHPEVQATQVEIDSAVIDAAKAYLPSICDNCFDSPRARVVIADGIQFVRNHPGPFDVVIVDSTDPVGMAVGLFQESFYRDVFDCLSEEGLVAAQSSSPLLMAEDLRAQVKHMRAVFPIVRTYLGLVPGYPGGLWSYTIGSKRHDPAAVSEDVIAKRLGRANLQTRYYTPQIHRAAFVLPRFIAEIVGPLQGG